jgi:hypothetical protein
MLEDEKVTWDPVRSTFSPGRIDAAVWGLTELMLGESTTGILDWIGAASRSAGGEEGREAGEWDLMG